MVNKNVHLIPQIGGARPPDPSLRGERRLWAPGSSLPTGAARLPSNAPPPKTPQRPTGRAFERSQRDICVLPGETPVRHGTLAETPEAAGEAGRRLEGARRGAGAEPRAPRLTWAPGPPQRCLASRPPSSRGAFDCSGQEIVRPLCRFDCWCFWFGGERLSWGS